MNNSDSWTPTLWTAALAGLAFSFLYQKCFAPKKKTPWPSLPGAVPLLGNRFNLKYLTREVRAQMRQYGVAPFNKTGLLEIQILHNRLLVVCNNQIASEIIKLRPNKITRNRSGNEAIGSVGGDGVFSAHGEIWAKDRRIFAPPLNPKNLKDYLPFIRIVTKRLVEKWGAAPNATIAINQDIISYTIDNIGLIAFDQDLDCLRKPYSQHADDLKKLFQLVYYRALSPIWYWRFPLVGQYLDGAAFVCRRIHNNVQGVIRSFQAQEGRGTVDGRSKETYLEKILCQPDFSQGRIMGNLITMFAAGSDTTGNTIMICLWEMLQENQKEYYEELVEEVHALPTNVEEVSYDDLMKSLPKMRAFVAEINRLKGTAPVVFVETAQTVEIGGMKIPPGLQLYLDCSYLGTLEGSGIPDGPKGEPSAVFCPRRWLSQAKDSKEWTFVKPSAKTGVTHSSGFGAGVRICPGQHLAEVEVVYCLASLLEHFELSLKPNHPPMELMTNFTETPDTDIEVIVKPRGK